MIKLGCCGFPVARKRYYRQFKAVEIQKTFYQPPKPETAQRWREEAPEDFEFTLKAWQLITHPPQSPTYRRAKVEIPQSKRENYGYFRPTDEVFGAREKTRRIAQALKAKLIIFQCPASFKPTQRTSGIWRISSPRPKGVGCYLAGSQGGSGRARRLRGSAVPLTFSTLWTHSRARLSMARSTTSASMESEATDINTPERSF